MSTIAKWGNSLALRIPSGFARTLKLEVGTHIQFQKKGNSLVITPIKKQYELNKLLKGITEENVHHEFDWGDATGEEIW